MHSLKWISPITLQISNSCQSLKKSCPSMTNLFSVIPILTKNTFYEYFLWKNTVYESSSSNVQLSVDNCSWTHWWDINFFFDTRNFWLKFECHNTNSSNTFPLYLRAQMFPIGVCFRIILSTEMKFTCQNDRNEITPAMSFISGYFM